MQVTLKNRSNALAWNPMEAYTFTVANEDYKLDSSTPYDYCVILCNSCLCTNCTKYFIASLLTRAVCHYCMKYLLDLII